MGEPPQQERCTLTKYAVRHLRDVDGTVLYCWAWDVWASGGWECQPPHADRPLEAVRSGRGCPLLQHHRSGCDLIPSLRDPLRLPHAPPSPPPSLPPTLPSYR